MNVDDMVRKRCNMDWPTRRYRPPMAPKRKTVGGGLPQFGPSHLGQGYHWARDRVYRKGRGKALSQSQKRAAELRAARDYRRRHAQGKGPRRMLAPTEAEPSADSYVAGQVGAMRARDKTMNPKRTHGHRLGDMRQKEWSMLQIAPRMEFSTVVMHSFEMIEGRPSSSRSARPRKEKRA